MWNVLTVTYTNDIGYATEVRLLIGCRDMAEDAYNYFLGTGRKVELTQVVKQPSRSSLEVKLATNLSLEFGQYMEQLARLN